MQSNGKDLKGQTCAAYASASASVTAGGSGDATEVVGDTLALASFASRPTSVVFEIPVTATLADTETITIAAEIEYYNGTAWADLVASSTILTLTSDGGTTEKAVARIGADLIHSDLVSIRVKFTPDCSAANTDTAVVGQAVAVFGGMVNTPVTGPTLSA